MKVYEYIFKEEKNIKNELDGTIFIKNLENFYNFKFTKFIIKLSFLC